MPRFCASCGAALGVRAPVSCPACGTAHWLNARPGAAALVVDSGKLLLVRRAHDPWLGCWWAPSGFCDGSEHPIDCAEREAFEEAGVRIQVVGYLGHWITEYAPATDAATEPTYAAVAYYHAVPVDDAEATPDGIETNGAAWFAPSELPDALAPPATAPHIYAAWREACMNGLTTTPLPDRPFRR